MGYAIQYKTNGVVGQLDPAGSIVQTWHLFYMYPKDVNHGDSDYTSDDVSDITVNFRYDYAVPGTELGLGSNVTGPNGEPYPSVLK